MIAIFFRNEIGFGLNINTQYTALNHLNRYSSDDIKIKASSFRGQIERSIRNTSHTSIKLIYNKQATNNSSKHQNNHFLIVWPFCGSVCIVMAHPCTAFFASYVGCHYNPYLITEYTIITRIITRIITMMIHCSSKYIGIDKTMTHRFIGMSNPSNTKLYRLDASCSFRLALLIITCCILILRHYYIPYNHNISYFKLIFGCDSMLVEYSHHNWLTIVLSQPMSYVQYYHCKYYLISTSDTFAYDTKESIDM